MADEEALNAKLQSDNDIYYYKAELECGSTKQLSV